MPACAACEQQLTSSCFSKGQLKKGQARRCGSCISSAASTSAAASESQQEPSNNTKALLAHSFAASVIAAVDKGSGIRESLYDKQLKIPNSIRPKVQALVAEVIKSLSMLRSVLSAVPGPWVEDPSLTFLAAVLVHEMIVQGRTIKGGAKHALCRNVYSLRKPLEAALEASGDGSSGGDRPKKTHVLPRYVRVNTLRASVMAVVEQLLADVTASDDTRMAATEKMARKIAEAQKDPIIPDLLRLPPRTNLHGHPLVEDGTLIQQDRASCLPAFALSPPPGAVVLDSCAAPGNKTTQLAALVSMRRDADGHEAKVAGHASGGKVYAFERNSKRAATLRAMVERAGAADAVRVCEVDFLRSDTQSGPVASATMALCDPSCSGSGGAGGHLMEEKGAAADGDYWDKVRDLAALQLSILTHAMSFPKMQVVVYSTCSIHRIENEDVVAAALEASGGAGWKLVRALPEWPTRGLPDSPHGQLCVRAGASDETHGFFVARFERSLI